MTGELIASVTLPGFVALLLGGLTARALYHVGGLLKKPTNIADVQAGPVLVAGVLHATAPALINTNRAPCILTRSRYRAVIRTVTTSGSKTTIQESDHWLTEEEEVGLEATLRDKQGNAIAVDLRGVATALDVTPAIHSWKPDDFATIRPLIAQGLPPDTIRVELIESSILDRTHVTLQGTAIEVDNKLLEEQTARYRELPKRALAIKSDIHTPLSVMMGGRARVVRRTIVPLVLMGCILAVLVWVASSALEEIRVYEHLAKQAE